MADGVMRSGTDPVVELWADDSEESEYLRARLLGFGIAFREAQISGSDLPALKVGGSTFSSRDGINIAIRSLIRRQREREGDNGHTE
jgi:hypothetical protein